MSLASWTWIQLMPLKCKCGHNRGTGAYFADKWSNMLLQLYTYFRNSALFHIRPVQSSIYGSVYHITTSGLHICVWLTNGAVLWHKCWSTLVRVTGRPQPATRRRSTKESTICAWKTGRIYKYISLYVIIKNMCVDDCVNGAARLFETEHLAKHQLNTFISKRKKANRRGRIGKGGKIPLPCTC